MTQWDWWQQWIRVAIYIFAGMGVAFGYLTEEKALTVISIMVGGLNIAWTTNWNSKEVATVTGLETKGRSSAAEEVKQVKGG